MGVIARYVNWVVGQAPSAHIVAIPVLLYRNTGMDKPDPVRPERLQWHPAFLQALQLELIDYNESLQFKYEYQLTTEPLRIDLLIIKKPHDMVIHKNIARIFRSDNILEF
ncbi:MAG: hypothetical protein LBL56_05440, partial [Treponema sp.]|nr:hypothetical protein [Treponema sp.]